MSPELSEYLPLIIGGIIGAIVAVLFVMRLNRRARVVSESDTKDVLDEGAAPAQRNEALIKAAPAAEKAVPPPPEPAPEPAPQAQPAPAPPPPPAPAPAPVSADDLTRIKGLGPKLATMLGEQGITSYAQIAAWTDSDVERIDAALGRFAGRITRDQWVEQAKLLAKGEESGFAERFGQNG